MELQRGAALLILRLERIGRRNVNLAGQPRELQGSAELGKIGYLLFKEFGGEFYDLLCLTDCNRRYTMRKERYIPVLQ